MTKKKLAGITIALLAGAITAHAQTGIRPAYQFPAPPPASGPASIQLGDSPLFVTPYVGLAYGRDDNVLLTSSNELKSDVVILSPGLSIDARSANSVLSLDLQSQIGRYRDSEEDDYVDHTARMQYDVAFDRRNFLRFGYQYLRSHDPRGSTDRGIGSEPDKYRLSAPSITYAFGAPGAAGRIETYYSYTDKRYINNRAATELSDRKTNEFGGVFYWRVMPRTYALAEARRTHIDFRSPASIQGAQERRFYAGVSWEATAATIGTVKVGRLERRYEDVDRPKFDATSWEAIVTWLPRTYSKFDFYTARQTNEATGLGDFILSSMYGVNWDHSWSSVLMTGVNLRYSKDEYQGFDRTDDVKSIGLKVGYKFRRWLTFGAEYTHTRRESNLPSFDYDKNLYLLTATASM